MLLVQRRCFKCDTREYEGVATGEGTHTRRLNKGKLATSQRTQLEAGATRDSRTALHPPLLACPASVLCAGPAPLQRDARARGKGFGLGGAGS
jgi:hypothetical protein